MSFCWKTAINYLQTHPKSNSWRCFGKFRIITKKWALIFTKLKKKWLRKLSLKLLTPNQKWAEFTTHNMHSIAVPLHFHDLQWKQNLFHTLVEGKIKIVLYPWIGVCHVEGLPCLKEWLWGSMNVYYEQRILTIFGGRVGNFMLHFLSHFFFNF